MTFKPGVDLNELARRLVAQTYPLVWGMKEDGAFERVTHLHHKAVATVLRELAADPKKAYSPTVLEQMADYLDPDEGEAAA